MLQAEETMANLKDLAIVSKEINEKSNQVNQILKDLERKLIAMNLGVEVWLSDYPLKSTPDSEPWEDNHGEEHETKLSIDEVLGFGRVGDRFALLVKEVTYEEDLQYMGNWDERKSSQPRPLLEMPRGLRIEALGEIEHLIDALLKEAKRVVEAIDKGKNTVDQL